MFWLRVRLIRIYYLRLINEQHSKNTLFSTLIKVFRLKL